MNKVKVKCGCFDYKGCQKEFVADLSQEELVVINIHTLSDVDVMAIELGYNLKCPYCGKRNVYPKLDETKNNEIKRTLKIK